ncbi:hypothetical protein [Clostridium perfringens]|uniref:hypothetical protein n=1 Tax=Clostridium perfringens TaxID=1502 RepID=UPI0024BC1706|nr:hypothetical protein [Clostridium perfringens]
MFYDYDIENMKIEEMDIVGDLETIDESIKNIKKTMKETGENLESVLDDMQCYKKKYGGDCLCGWCNADNDEAFVGYIFIRENKIIDIVPYM